MSMWELFVNDEVIDRRDLKTNVYEEAHTYFRLIKNLSNTAFNDIFVVKEYIPPKKPLGEIKWWKADNMNLDIDKE